MIKNCKKEKRIVKISRAYVRTIVLALLLGLLLPILAACGGSSETPASTLPTTDTAPAVDARPTNPAATNAPPPTPAAAATAPAAPATPPPAAGPADLTGPLKTPYLEFGVVEHLYYTDRGRVLDLTNIAGFDWVRQQVVWKDVEGPTPGNYAWGDLDNIVNEVAAHKLKLLISVVQAPSFHTADGKNGLPKDPKSLGDFVEAMVKRYGDKIQAYEIWNEQNLAHENGGRVTIEDAGRYVEILAESYKRIKVINPAAFVLAGPPSSSGVNDPSLAVSDENYYRAMYSYKNGMIKQFFDAQAVHPGGAANPPDTLWPDNPSKAQGWNDHQTHYFRHIENVRRFMIEEGVGDHQIWITEFGWATKNITPGYEFGNQVSFDQQRDYIIGAMKRTYEEYRDEKGDPWVGVTFLWNMNYAVIKGAQNEPLHEQASFGILDPDWSPRPSFIAIQGFLDKVKKERPR